MSNQHAIYTLYRHFNAQGSLLYVGASCDPFHRMANHRASIWFHDVATITLERFPTTELLCEAERVAIQNETPSFNVQHRKHQQNPAPVKGWSLRGFEYACRKWFRHIHESERIEAIRIAMEVAGLEFQK